MFSQNCGSFHSVIKDLNFCFNRKFKLVSSNIMIYGNVTYKMLIDDDVLTDAGDIKNRNDELRRFLRCPKIYKKIDNIYEIQSRTTACSEFLAEHCTSTSYNKLGKTNCALVPMRYIDNKNKLLKSEKKLRNKFYKLLELKCVHV